MVIGMGVLAVGGFSRGEFGGYSSTVLSYPAVATKEEIKNLTILNP